MSSKTPRFLQHLAVLLVLLVSPVFCYYECNSNGVCYEYYDDLSVGIIVAIIGSVILFFTIVVILICYCCACCCFLGRRGGTGGQVYTTQVVQQPGPYQQQYPAGVTVISGNSQPGFMHYPNQNQVYYQSAPPQYQPQQQQQPSQDSFTSGGGQK